MREFAEPQLKPQQRTSEAAAGSRAYATAGWTDPEAGSGRSLAHELRISRFW